jgi:hypothetical protein
MHQQGCIVYRVGQNNNNKKHTYLWLNSTKSLHYY